MRTVKGFIPLIALALLLGACGREGSIVREPEDLPVIALSASCDGGQTLSAWRSGTTKDGSLYEIYRPGNWSSLARKRLVVFAHGYFDPYFTPSPTLPNVYTRSNDKMVCHLVANGFAVAWSSYAHNGYAVKSGFESTEELRGIAAQALFPSSGNAYAYVVGASQGGLIAAMLAEKKTTFHGALATCGPVGGWPMQIQYVGDVRVLFDYYFNANHSIIPTTNASQPAINLPNPPPTWTTNPDSQVVAKIREAVLKNTSKAREMAAVKQINLPYANDTQLVQSFLEPLYFNVRGTGDLISRAGGSPFGNSTLSYTGSSNDTALNRGVIRYSPTSSAAVSYARSYYRTTGRLQTRLLTLHTTRDAAVPYTHETTYAKRVAAEGQSGRLAQQHVNRYGHCNFTDSEQYGALNDLVKWVESGTPPPTGNVTNRSF